MTRRNMPGTESTTRRVISPEPILDNFSPGLE